MNGFSRKPPLKCSCILISRLLNSHAKFRSQAVHANTGLRNITNIKKSFRVEVPKESITKGPNETLLKPFANEHPALDKPPTERHLVPDFETLGLRIDLCNAVKAIHIHKPTKIQIHTIQRILEGQNVLCASQTGSGKTLAYLLPILHLLKNQEDIEGIVPRLNRPRACIVVPFRELAVQVLGVVKYLSHFTKLRSLGLISGRKKKWISEGLSKPVDIVVGTPHTLLKYQEKGDVYLSDLSFLVMDEADTMFDASFMPMAVDILKYAGVISKSWTDDIQPTQSTFITATVPQDIIKAIDSIVPNINICSADLHQILPHVSQTFVKIPQHKKCELLADMISRELQKSMKKIMVFCNTTKSCDWTSYFLEEQGIAQVRLNGDMTKKERRSHLKRFNEVDDAPVLVCTDMASRGLDTTNVSHVINFDFPVSVVDYLHRAGRTGRLGYVSTTVPPQVTSFLSHNNEITIMEQIKKAMQKNIPLEDVSLWKSFRRKKQQR